ncbi:U3 small nucleolar RNA-associated protein 25 homolog [Saccoglossus kowalevskii]
MMLIFSQSESSASEEEVQVYQQLISSLENAEEEKPIESDEDDFDDDEEDVVVEEEKEEPKLEDSIHGDVTVHEEQEQIDEEEVKPDDTNDIVAESQNDEEESSDKEQVERDFGDQTRMSDPFYTRLGLDMSEKVAEQLTLGKIIHRNEIKWPRLGQMIATSQCDQDINVKISKEKNVKDMHVRKRILDHLQKANKPFITEKSSDILSPLQRELFSIMNNYQDLMYTERSCKSQAEVRSIYCLHVLNHVVKCRALVLKHNNLLSQKELDPDSDETKDQGLTRPRVLIVVPFRESALQIVDTFIKMLLPADKQQVAHRHRFQSEYGDERLNPSKLARPEDWELTFAGNIDDHFRIGIAITRKGIRLYSEFYSSDIIIASPLGLRTLIGVEGEKQRDFDFLSSIDILLFDQSDVFLMQNWEHIQHLMDHMHLQPKDSHGVDFSRVHTWIVNEWSQLYRQTLLFSSVTTPEMNALYSKYCRNILSCALYILPFLKSPDPYIAFLNTYVHYYGKITVCNPVSNGSICQIVTALPQVFQRIESSNYLESPQNRFDYFTTKVLPHFRDRVMSGTMIFVPSYFDYVRLRNYFRKEEINFAQICEYTKQSNISRARVNFFEGKRPLLLYTERFHFFRRYKIRGIKHIVFYQLPTYPNLYSELCNMMRVGIGIDNSCTVVYSKYDVHRLTGVVGTQRCAHMLSANKSIHMFVTGEDS